MGSRLELRGTGLSAGGGFRIRLEGEGAVVYLNIKLRSMLLPLYDERYGTVCTDSVAS